MSRVKRLSISRKKMLVTIKGKKFLVTPEQSYNEKTQEYVPMRPEDMSRIKRLTVSREKMLATIKRKSRSHYNVNDKHRSKQCSSHTPFKY